MGDIIDDIDHAERVANACEAIGVRGDAECVRRVTAALRATMAPREAAPTDEQRAEAWLRARELRANDHKGGWKECDVLWLLSRLSEEATELRRAIGDGGFVLGEAADVANFAMMIADVCGALTVTPDRGTCGTCGKCGGAETLCKQCGCPVALCSDPTHDNVRCDACADDGKEPKP